MLRRICPVTLPTCLDTSPGFTGRLVAAGVRIRMHERPHPELG